MFRDAVGRALGVERLMPGVAGRLIGRKIVAKTRGVSRRRGPTDREPLSICRIRASCRGGRRRPGFQILDFHTLLACVGGRDRSHPPVRIRGGHLRVVFGADHMHRRNPLAVHPHLDVVPLPDELLRIAGGRLGSRSRGGPRLQGKHGHTRHDLGCLVRMESQHPLFHI